MSVGRSADDGGDGDVVAGHGVGEVGGGGVGVVGADEEFTGLGLVAGFFVEGGEGHEDIGAIGQENECFFVVDEGVVVVAEFFVSHQCEAGRHPCRGRGLLRSASCNGV